MHAITNAIDIHDIASLLHQAGQQILLPMFHRQQDLHRQHKADHSIVTEADMQCQQFLQQQLQRYCEQCLPADLTIGFLGEEMSEQEQLASLNTESLYWCLDPLDGTGNFAYHIPLFSISLALIYQGKPCMAWIYDPIRQEMFTAGNNHGLCLNGRRVLQRGMAATLREATGFVDFKRLPSAICQRLIQPSIYRSQRNLGSCALEWAWLASGRSAFIIHGGQRLWDFAAGVLLCQQSACIVSDFSAAPLFPRNNLQSSVIATANDTIYRQLLDFV